LSPRSARRIFAKSALGEQDFAKILFSERGFGERALAQWPNRVLIQGSCPYAPLRLSPRSARKIFAKSALGEQDFAKILFAERGFCGRPRFRSADPHLRPGKGKYAASIRKHSQQDPLCERVTYASEHRVSIWHQ
jgi:hypothetical protein